MKKRQYRESSLQQSCITWFILQYPEIEKYSFSTLNGARLSMIEAIRLKKEGFKRGVLDWFCLYPNARYNGIIIEFKDIGKKPTSEQSEMIDRLKNVGFDVHVCYKFEDFVNIINDYFSRKTNIIYTVNNDINAHFTPS